MTVLLQERRPRRERADNAARRRAQILDATIESIVRHGLSATTLATVADAAGLSQGVTVFYFKTKQALLAEALRWHYEEYRAVWRAALDAAPDDPVQRILALVRADFDPAICNRRTLTLWHAFWGEATARPLFAAISEELRPRARRRPARAVRGGGRSARPRRSGPRPSSRWASIPSPTASGCACISTPTPWTTRPLWRSLSAAIAAAFPSRRARRSWRRRPSFRWTRREIQLIVPETAGAGLATEVAMAATRRRHAWRAPLLGTASYLAVALLAPRMAAAEVATDGSLGRRVSLRGGDIEIGAGLGQQRGGNLFHSFQKFDVETGGRVTFTGPGSVKNVIGRVTGGEPSSIDGTLASTIPDADLYLLNPAGILFGPNARLDVKGSFHASTADELRLADGAVFSALDTAGSTLSVAEPQAFGFLGAPPGAITVDNSRLGVPAGMDALTGGRRRAHARRGGDSRGGGDSARRGGGGGAGARWRSRAGAARHGRGAARPRRDHQSERRRRPGRAHRRWTDRRRRRSRANRRWRGPRG